MNVADRIICAIISSKNLFFFYQNGEKAIEHL